MEILWLKIQENRFIIYTQQKNRIKGGHHEN